MTKKCLFERATGLFVSGTSHDDLPHDTATHIQLTLSDYPDRRSERWNGAAGTRAATAQELADFDDAGAETRAMAEIDGLKGLKALAVETLIEINALRTNAGLPTLAAADWRQRLIDRYKSL